MSMRITNLIKPLFIVFFASTLLSAVSSVFGQQQPVVVTVTEPARNGVAVAKDMDVTGSASMPSGQHLWVLVHRIKGFKEVWWPQDEAEVDPRTGEWEVRVVFGGPQDIGYDFEIAAITVNQQEHLSLMAYRRQALLTGHWPPIEMPSTTSHPVIRRITKVRHD